MKFVDACSAVVAIWDSSDYYSLCDAFEYIYHQNGWLVDALLIKKQIRQCLTC